MIIYEVNLKIAADIQIEYMQWLEQHVQEMLQFTGFLEAITLKDEETDDPAFVNLTVHYLMDTKENLQHYLNEHSQNMRAKGLKKFPNKFTATRKTFEVIQKASNS